MLEIDQSNKIERLEKDTVIALANNSQRAIIIPSQVKRQAMALLRKNGKSRNAAVLNLFSVGVFLLLEPYLQHNHRLEVAIMIDSEYTGHEVNIRSTLLRYAHKTGLPLSKGQICFGQVGKKSRAHSLAWHIQRNQQKPDTVLTLDDLARLL